MAAHEFHPAAEFQAIPLENIIATPLLSAIKAQAAAASATHAYIQSFINEGKPLTVDLKLSILQNGNTKEVAIKAPLLSMITVPHIRIDSLTTHFKYEISQVTKNIDEFNYGINIETEVTKNPILNFSLKGSVSNKSSEESTLNRSGFLEITIHASEAPIPEGLARLLSVLARALPEE